MKSVKNKLNELMNRKLNLFTKPPDSRKMIDGLWFPIQQRHAHTIWKLVNSVKNEISKK
jgi:hypothetical protein